MNIKKITAVSLLSVGLSTLPLFAFANQVTLTTNKPIDIAYQVAHKNPGGEVILGAMTTSKIASSLTVNVDPDKYALSGLIITEVDGHKLPPEMTRFDTAQSCSMTLNKEHDAGRIGLERSEHRIQCYTYGGVYGK